MKFEKKNFRNILGGYSDAFSFFDDNSKNQLGVIVLSKANVEDFVYWDFSIVAPGHGKEVFDYWLENLSNPYKQIGVLATTLSIAGEKFIKNTGHFEKHKEHGYYVLKF